MKFCFNKLCAYHVNVNSEIVNRGYIELHNCRQVRRYPYRKILREKNPAQEVYNKVEILMFCEVCKEAVDMTVD